jgi:hypothetical protein
VVSIWGSEENRPMRRHNTSNLLPTRLFAIFGHFICTNSAH